MRFDLTDQRYGAMGSRASDVLANLYRICICTIQMFGRLPDAGLLTEGT